MKTIKLLSLICLLSAVVPAVASDRFFFRDYTGLFTEKVNPRLTIHATKPLLPLITAGAHPHHKSYWEQKEKEIELLLKLEIKTILAQQQKLDDLNAVCA